MTDAAFRATYSDLKLIKGRKVVQFVFEVPIEESYKAYEVLGGMPNPAAEVWCAIARLNLGEDTQKSPPNNSGDQKRKLYARIGATCREPTFFNYVADMLDLSNVGETEAARYVRETCGVLSRRDILPGSDEEDLFLKLRNDYELWKTAQGLAGRT